MVLAFMTTTKLTSTIQLSMLLDDIRGLGFVLMKVLKRGENLENTPKKEALLTMQAITEVSTKNCCQKNCLQPFPREQIQAIHSQLHVDGGVKFRKFQLLQVHKQIHPSVDGKDVVTLEGVDVCSAAWREIHGVSKATFYRYREMSRAGMRANVVVRKPK